jgi:hypothetical protein
MDLQTKQFLPRQSNDTELEQLIRTLTEERIKVRMRPVARGTDEDLRQELADMTQDTQQSGEDVRSLRTQFANAMPLGARATPAATQAPEDRGQKCPYSPDFSGLD